MKTIVAVLDTMWGSEEGKAARYFRINPENHSGKRLYKLVGPRNHLVVTNACREMTNSSKKHGLPDSSWLEENLKRLEKKSQIDVLLVCGKVALKAFENMLYMPKAKEILYLPHPAARNWSKKMLSKTAKKIQKEKK